MTKSSLIGAFIGAVPGTGGAIASLLPTMKQREKPNQERSLEKVRSKVLQHLNQQIMVLQPQL